MAVSPNQIIIIIVLPVYDVVSGELANSPVLYRVPIQLY